jgi:hypothetical protein
MVAMLALLSELRTTLFIWSILIAGICDKLLRLDVNAFFKLVLFCYVKKETEFSPMLSFLLLEGLVTLCSSLLIILFVIVSSSSSESSID